MKIIVTGSGGFLGQNLMPRLNAKFGKRSVVGFSKKKYDLCQQDQCRDLILKYRPDVVIHAAGTVGGIGANKENPGKFIYENLIMGTNIIHSSFMGEVKKFILLGTVCSYPKFTQVPFKEDSLWLGYPEETNAPYGIAKKTLNEMLIAYKAQYGFNSTTLLPANMYGPHDHFNLTSSHVIPAIILKIDNAIKNGDKEIVIWGSGKPSREFLYVDDCCDAIISAIDSETDPYPMNVGTGTETTIMDTVEIIADLMDFKGQILFDNTKPDGQPRRCLDVTRVKNVLNFKAKTPLVKGLSNTIDWYRSNL